MGPNVTTEARILAAADYRDSWHAEIEHAVDVLQTVMNEYQYNMLITSYESWKVYMEQFTGVERNMFYLGGVSGDFETYPHVSEVEATRTKDFAIQLLALEYAYTGDVEYAFQGVE